MKKDIRKLLSAVGVGICLLLTANILNAQTGPGGVGNNDGSSGQPQNIIWLDAASLGLTDGDDVTTWTDLSGNGNNLSQSNTTLTPYFMDNGTDNLNGFPIIRFSQDDNRILKKPFNDFPTSGITTIVVLKTSETDNNALISYAEDDESNYNEYLVWGTDALTVWVEDASQITGVDFSTGSWEIMVNKWESSSGVLSVNKNGDQDYSTTNFQLARSLEPGGCFVIGGEQDALDGDYDIDQDFDGDIAEIIMFSSSLNTAQTRIIENYLSEKYNLSLTTIGNDVYGNDADFNAAYTTDIAGIGQESDGDHTQTSSGGIYLYERNTTLANGEYVMLGHDGTANNSTTTYTGADLPSGTEASWARQWYVEKTVSDGIDVKLIFDFKEALTDGSYPSNVSNYVLLYRSGVTGAYSKVTVADQGINDADQVYFDVSNANLQNGYYTIGTDDQVNSPVEGVEARTWYALVSGDWDDWEYWTLDPSGALPNNPGKETPGKTDNVVIHTGKTITLTSNNDTLSSITVEGILDLGTTTGHDFNEINGNGRIRIKGDNFPDGDATHFITAGQGEGTVVFQGTTYSLATAQTYFDVEIKLDDVNQSITLLDNLTVNGDISITTGDLIINNTGTTVLTVDVAGDVTVESNGEIGVGTGNTYGTHSLYHQFIIGGDFTNNGSVEFTNRGAANYTADDGTGAVEVIFNNNSADQSVQCNGPTIFNQLTCDKGTDATYILELTASATANFEIYGRVNEISTGTSGSRDGNKALRLLAGTLKLGSNIVIPQITIAADYTIDSDARLWVANNANVYASGTYWIYVYGELRITDDAIFTEEMSEGVIIGEQGTVKIEGGTINLEALTTSVNGAPGSQVGSYIQSGGDVNINERRSGNNGIFAPFHLPFTSNIFAMSGGTLTIKDQGFSGPGDYFGLVINSSEGNYNVTGGTVIIERTIDYYYNFISRAPFWNLILRNSYGNSSYMQLLAYSDDPHNEVEDIELVSLNVLNDFTIEGTNGLEFRTNSADVYIGGDFTIESGATYTSGSNTTYFNTDKNSDIIIGATTGSVGLNNLTINKDLHPTTGSYYDVEIAECTGRPTDPANADNTIIQVSGNLEVQRGQFTIERYTVGLSDSLKMSDGNLIYNESLPGRVTLNNTTQQILQGSLIYSPSFGNIELDNTGGAAITTNVDMEYFIMSAGILDINTNRLSVDTNFIDDNNGPAPYDNFSASKMIETDADHGAKGLRLKLDGDYSSGGTVIFPVGSNGNWAKLDLVIDNTVGTISGGGYLTFIPVDLAHPTRAVGGCDAIDGYWRVKTENLSTINSGIDYNIYCPYAKPGGGNSAKEAYFIDGTWYDTGDSPNTPGTLTFDDGNTNLDGFIDEVDFSFAKTTCYNQVNYVYSNGTGGGNWDVGGSWDGGAVPESHDYAYIRSGDTITVTRSNLDNAGKLIIESGGVLDIGAFTGLTYNIVSGGGKIRIDYSSGQVPTADYDNFMYNDTAIFEYYGVSYTLHTDFPVYPNLSIAGTARKTLPNNMDVLVRKNLYVDGDELQTNNGENLVILDSLIIENGGSVRLNRGNQSEVTVYKSIDLSGVGSNSIYLRDGNGNTAVNKLNVYENIVLSASSSIDLYNPGGSSVKTADLYFLGDNNSTVNGVGATLDFNRIIINKSVYTSDVYINEDFNLNGATDGTSSEKALYLLNGDLTLNNGGIDINLATGGSDYNIPGTSSLEIAAGVVNVTGDDVGIFLDSKLLISGGTVNMDDPNYPATTNGNNYIEYSGSGDAQIKITSGTLSVGSQVRRALTSTTGVLRYDQSGGTASIGVNDAPEGNRGVLEILNDGSLFRHEGGDLYISNAQTSATIASLYLDPDTVDVGIGTTINIGDSNTKANQTIGIYSVATLENFIINNTSTETPKVKAKMWTIPLTLNGDLNINTGTTLNANGNDLNIYGNFVNSGTFIPNQNITYFKGTTDQSITGNTTFYNLVNQNTANLNLTAASADIVINDFTNQSGSTINDNSNEIHVEGNIDMSGVHVYGGSGDGITLNGTSLQQLSGSGTFGKLTVNNPFDIEIPIGNALKINNYLKLISGVLDVGNNLLTLNENCIIQEANPFGANNMIQTTASFTDNGVKKIFSSGAFSFIYPIGSGNKYTPVEIIATQNTQSNAYLVAKGADEYHPSIVNDSEGTDPAITDTLNVLQYYWVLTANGFTDLLATVEMTYDTSDVEVTAPYDVYDYITAKLLNDGSGNWLKFDDVSKFDETNKKLIFNIDEDAEDVDITGEYTAGVDGSSFSGAIPDNVPLYQSNGTNALLDWNTASTWRVDDGTGTWVLPATQGLPDIPKGARVRILANDTVQTIANYIAAYTLELNGVLDVGTTFGNRTGVVTGQGKLYTERGTLPAGYYESFFSSTGGTVEFGGSTDYSVLSNVSQVRHIIFSGTGLRELPNLELTILGDLLFSDSGTSAPDVVNEFDENLIVSGNITFNAGTFDAGGGDSKITMNGTSAQTIDGINSFTGTNALWNFEINNSNGVTLNTAVDVDQDLTLTNGIIYTDATNVLSVTNTGATVISSSTEYVDGPLRKNIGTNLSFMFPVGDAVRYGELELVSTATTGAQYWEVEYYNSNPNDHATLDTSSRELGLERVSGNEYWRVEGPVGDSTKVRIRWDSQSILPAMTNNRTTNLKIVEWDNVTDNRWEVVQGTVTDGGVNSGTILSDYRVDYDPNYVTLGTYESNPLPAAGFLTLDTTVCDGSTITLRVQLEGSPNWTLYVHDGTSTTTHNAIGSSPFTFNVTPSGPTTTYTIDSVSDNTGVTTSATIFGNPVVVTVVSLPTPSIVAADISHTFCANDTTNYSVTNNAGNTYNWIATGGNIIAGQGTNAVTVVWLTGPGDISVTETTPETCAGSDNIAITVNPSPTLSVSATPGTICFGETSQLDAGFAGATSYLWSPAGELGGNEATQNPVYTPGTNPTSPTQITTTFTVTVTNAGCSTVGTVDVIVNRRPETGPQYHIENNFNL